MTQFISLFQAAVAFGTVILFGAAGEILTEKSGNLNLGVPGIMYLGGIAGLAGAFFYESAVAEPNKLLCLLIALICALAASALGGDLQCADHHPACKSECHRIDTDDFRFRRRQFLRRLAQ